jgi:integrase
VTGKRRFGSVRQFPSGRWQARYVGPTGLRHTAPRTFATKTDALVWLDVQAAEIARDAWRDPDAGRVPLGPYASKWVVERPVSPRTADKYERLLRLHIAPQLGGVDLVDLNPARVRTWRVSLLNDGVGSSTVAGAYRLLRAVMNTALDDELIQGRNPCRLKGADKESTPERPTISVEQMYAIADAIQPWYRTLVLLSGTTGLRWGELIGLRRHDLDMVDYFVNVADSAIELDGSINDGPTKSQAGVRFVGIPSIVVDDLADHLGRWSEEGGNGRVFVGPKGAIPKRSNFNRYWQQAVTFVADSGMIMPDDLHFHDLRHTANGFASDVASLRELMARMGHSTPRAALIYQHAQREREREIAKAVSSKIEAELARTRRSHP